MSDDVGNVIQSLRSKLVMLELNSFSRILVEET